MSYGSSLCFILYITTHHNSFYTLYDFFFHCYDRACGGMFHHRLSLPRSPSLICPPPSTDLPRGRCCSVISFIASQEYWTDFCWTRGNFSWFLPAASVPLSRRQKRLSLRPDHFGYTNALVPPNAVSQPHIQRRGPVRNGMRKTVQKNAMYKVDFNIDQESGEIKRELSWKQYDGNALTPSFHKKFLWICPSLPPLVYVHVFKSLFSSLSNLSFILPTTSDSVGRCFTVFSRARVPDGMACHSWLLPAPATTPCTARSQFLKWRR